MIDISWWGFKIFSYCWIVLAILVFFVLLFVAAPYGRHSSLKWGPMISNRLGWVIMELPVLVALWTLVVPYFFELSYTIWIMLFLFSLHYINRIFIFPFRIHTKGKQMPLVIAGSAIFFNLINGFSLGYYFTHFANYPAYWFRDIRFISGTLLFLTGMYINLKADNKLIALRKPGETHYIIPQGWLFNRISCPNLFGELIEWLGFALLCWNLPGVNFFIWTMANLIPRAMSHHRWYQAKFINYPLQRKSIIPFVL